MLDFWRQLGGARAATRRRRLVTGALAAAACLEGEPDSSLLRAARALRWQTREMRPTDQLIVEGFALVREAARRVHGKVHYPAQLAAGVVLASGGLAEMQTGEGKTLTALLPAFLYALAGQGTHVVTANDYLAQRDARFAAAVFERLGLTVGCVTSDLPYDQRGPQYACDVTYGAAREFGFDFLRDRLAAEALNEQGRAQGCATCAQQRARYFALVDEADSVLIDDARTPLLIAVGGNRESEDSEFYRWCHRAATALDAQRDMVFDHAQRSIRLTNEGCRRVLEIGRLPAGKESTFDRAFHQVEQSLVAHFLLRRDRDYVVRAEGVEIVDTSTGRIAAGRKWRDGLQ
jgi:preprotein translocase subunit SecA